MPDSQGRYVTTANAVILGTPRILVTRQLSDGTLDASFGTGGTVQIPGAVGGERATGVAIDTSDDSIYVGAITDIGGTAVNSVFKLLDTGAADTSFDGDGQSDEGFAGADVARNIFVESSGNIVFVHNTTVDARLKRKSSTGSNIDTTIIDPGGGTQAYSAASTGTDGIYRVSTYDGVDRYAVHSNINTDTNTQVLIDTAGAVFDAAQDIRTAVDSTGNSYHSGTNPAGDAGVILKVDNALAIDAGFGTAGVVEIQNPSWAGNSADIKVVLPLAGTDLVAAGKFSDGLVTNWQTSRLAKSDGILVGSYGTNGIREYAIGGDSFVNAGLLEEADSRFVLAGQYDDGTAHPVTGRLLLTNGALDTSFGTF